MKRYYSVLTEPKVFERGGESVSENKHRSQKKKNNKSRLLDYNSMSIVYEDNDNDHYEDNDDSNYYSRKTHEDICS